MDQIFLSIINMSITATYVMAAVLVLRLLLKRAPKWISYSLWSVVLFRLVFPFSFTSSFSLLSRIIKPLTSNGSIEYIPSDIGIMAIPKVDLGLPGINSVINDSLPWTTQNTSVNPLQIVISIGTVVWLTGFIAMLIYSVVSYLRLKRRISTAIKICGNVFETDKIASPFVCGLFIPGIYLPIDLDSTNQAYVLQHEQTHLRRFDHIIKPLAFLVLSIHWFNPLIWLAFRLMSRDMEMSCDERVVQDLGKEEKASYGEALVHLAMTRPILSGSPLAFGESGTKGRVKNLLNYKKPAFWVFVVLILTLILAGSGLLANPRSGGPNYATYMGQKDYFGPLIYSTIDYQITEEERATVSPLLSTAEKVFTYSGVKADANLNVGALESYYRYSDVDQFASVDYDMQLITAKINNTNGYMWVVYSVERQDKDGEPVNGSWDILSYWKIEKADGQWNVVDIKEHQ